MQGGQRRQQHVTHRISGQRLCGGCASGHRQNIQVEPTCTLDNGRGHLGGSQRRRRGQQERQLTSNGHLSPAGAAPQKSIEQTDSPRGDEGKEEVNEKWKKTGRGRGSGQAQPVATRATRGINTTRLDTNTSSLVRSAPYSCVAKRTSSSVLAVWSWRRYLDGIGFTSLHHPRLVVGGRMSRPQLAS